MAKRRRPKHKLLPQSRDGHELLNTIHELTDINGTTVTTPEAVGVLVVHHLTNLFVAPLTIAAHSLQQQVNQATVFSFRVPTVDEII